MTPHVTPTATRVRIRWDNIAILAAALAVIAVGVPMLMGMGKTDAPAPAAKKVEPIVSEPAEQLSPYTLEQAQARVAEARTLMLQGKWAEAEELVADIGGSIGDESGASVLRNEIATRRAEYEQFELDAQQSSEAGKWNAVLTALTSAAKIAPLTPELVELQKRAKAMIMQDKAAASIMQLLDAGKLNDAHHAAQAAFDRYKTKRFEKLLAMVNKKMEARKQRIEKARLAKLEEQLAAEQGASQPATPSSGGNRAAANGGGNGQTTANAAGGTDFSALLAGAGGGGGAGFDPSALGAMGF